MRFLACRFEIEINSEFDMTSDEFYALRCLFAESGACADDMFDGDIECAAKAMQPFLTGSRVYGDPRPDSDIDLVVFMPNGDGSFLYDMTEDDPPDYKGKTARFGTLNLIIETDAAKFVAWKQGTEYLESISPVTRDVAVEHFKSLFAKIAQPTPKPIPTPNPGDPHEGP